MSERRPRYIDVSMQAIRYVVVFDGARVASVHQRPFGKRAGRKVKPGSAEYGRVAEAAFKQLDRE